MSIFLIILLLILTTTSSQDHTRLEHVTRVMTEKGFGDMAEMLVLMHATLFPDLETLESKNKTYTVFAPDNLSFWARSNYDPPLSLVQYQIVPFKVDMDLLGSPSMSEHKLESLVQGHPHVVTTGLPESFTMLPSIDLVSIGVWNVYNDGYLIVHGIFEFLNPIYQSSRYPWYDGPEAPAVSPAVAEVSTGMGSSYLGNTNHVVFSFLFPLAICLLFLRF